MSSSPFDMLNSGGPALLLVLAMMLCALPLGIAAIVSAIAAKPDKKPVAAITISALALLLGLLMGVVTVGNALYGERQMDEALVSMDSDGEFRARIEEQGIQEIQQAATVGFCSCSGPLILGLLGLGIALKKNKSQH